MEQMISATEIKNIVISRKNFDLAIIKSSIIEAAELDFIKPLLGDKLYDEIKGQYKVDAVAGDNIALVNNYLKNALAFYTIYLCLPTIMMDISGIGLQINSTEFSQSVSSSQRAEMASGILGLAKTFAKKATTYLQDQKDLGKFPLYNSADNVESTGSIIGGIILE